MEYMAYTLIMKECIQILIVVGLGNRILGRFSSYYFFCYINVQAFYIFSSMM